MALKTKKDETPIVEAELVTNEEPVNEIVEVDPAPEETSIVLRDADKAHSGKSR